MTIPYKCQIAHSMYFSSSFFQIYDALPPMEPLRGKKDGDDDVTKPVSSSLFPLSNRDSKVADSDSSSTSSDEGGTKVRSGTKKGPPTKPKPFPRLVDSNCNSLLFLLVLLLQMSQLRIWFFSSGLPCSAPTTPRAAPAKKSRATSRASKFSPVTLSQLWTSSSQGKSRSSWSTNTGTRRTSCTGGGRVRVVSFQDCLKVISRKFLANRREEEERIKVMGDEQREVIRGFTRDSCPSLTFPPSVGIPARPQP